MKKSHDGYQIVAFPRMRRLMITTRRVTSHKRTIRGLVELDVTKARQLMREYKARTGEGQSFTTYLTACVGHAVTMNKQAHAYRNWHNQLVLFDDVDIHIQVERDLRGAEVSCSPYRQGNQYQDRPRPLGRDSNGTGSAHTWPRSEGVTL